MADDYSLDPDVNFLNRFNECKSRYIEEIELNKFFDFSEPTFLNLLHVNCRGFGKNFNSLNTLLDVIGAQLSVIAVSETWLSDITEDTYLIKDYNFVSNSRSGRRGGGVGLYLKNDFAYKLRDDLSVSTDVLECIFVEILQLNTKKFIIGCVYRTRSTDLVKFNNDFLTLLNNLDKTGNILTFFLGDFNLDLLKSDLYPQTSEFLNNFMAHSFLPTITLPTRVTEHSKTLIDNIFINNFKNNFKTAVIYNDISDHFPVAMHFEM